MPRTDTRTAENKYQAIDVMTDETVGWYANANEAYLDPANRNRGIDVSYRPGRKSRKVEK